MSRADFNRDASILLLIAIVTGIGIALYCYAPKDEQPPEQEQEEPESLSHVSDTIWFAYPSGAWGTLPVDPKTGERGEQITEEELQTLRLADSK